MALYILPRLHNQNKNEAKIKNRPPKSQSKKFQVPFAEAVVCWIEFMLTGNVFHVRKKIIIPKKNGMEISRKS